MEAARGERCSNFGGHLQTDPVPPERCVGGIGASSLGSVDEDEERYEEEDEDYYAEDEDDETANERGELREYHRYPMPKVGFHGQPSGQSLLRPRRRTLYFGIENELTYATRRGRSRAIMGLCGPDDAPWTAAEDGSLDYGWPVEFISDPRTLRDWQSHILQPAISEAWRDANYDDGFGLHVHASRSPLSELTIAKLDYAMFAFQDPLRKIARRRYTNYCKAKTVKPPLRYNEPRGHQDRYQMLNLCNERTIEFRFFQASNEPKVVMAAIELCAALIEWCSVTPLQSIKWPAFMQWLAHYRQRKTYPVLIADLQRLGLMEKKGKDYVSTLAHAA